MATPAARGILPKSRSRVYGRGWVETMSLESPTVQVKLTQRGLIFYKTQRDHGNSIVRRALNALCFFLTL
jgi:hypothetical protein